jgi:putative ABC transport system substrate-binding protein
LWLIRIEIVVRVGAGDSYQEGQPQRVIPWYTDAQATGMKNILRLVLFVLILAVPAFAGDSVRGQQPKKISQVGWIALFGPDYARPSGLFTTAFLSGLRERGHIEGRNLIIHYRSAEGREDRLSEISAELVRLKVDVIVADNTRAAVAARGETKTIPIVLTDSADPVGSGLVNSLARPSGNVTGSSFMSPELTTKRLELLKEIIPGLSRVAALGFGTNPSLGSGHDKRLQLTAQSLEVQLQVIRIFDSAEFENIFSQLAAKHIKALFLVSHPFLTANSRQIVNLAAKSRIPAIYPHRGYVEIGGLASYGADHSYLLRRAAVYVDKILRGANPADLPVEQATKFELVINLKAARSINLTIPPALLMWADEVIQ